MALLFEKDSQLPLEKQAFKIGDALPPARNFHFSRSPIKSDLNKIVVERDPFSNLRYFT